MRHDGRGRPSLHGRNVGNATHRDCTNKAMAEWQKVSGEIGITTDLEAFRALYTCAVAGWAMIERMNRKPSPRPDQTCLSVQCAGWPSDHCQHVPLALIPRLKLHGLGVSSRLSRRPVE